MWTYERRWGVEMYNLMFVDDEQRVLEAMCNMIPWNELNINVVGTFDNPISALQSIIDEQPDILITDLMMPVMDGIELVTRVREMYPSVECLVLSGCEEFELAKSAVASGVRGYLVKPCRKEELIDSIKACIKNIERNQAYTLDSFEIRQSLVEEVYDKLMQIVLSNDEDDDESVRQLINQYRDYSLLKEAAIMVAVQNEMSALKLQKLIKKITNNQSAEVFAQSVVNVLGELKTQLRSTDPLIDNIVRYVYENYHVPSLNLQHIADSVAHLTPRYIGRRFLNVMNMKFSEFLLQVRMEKALELVRASDHLTANEIAEQIGLGNNVRYFYRLFRQHTGMTMREYKDSISEK